MMLRQFLAFALIYNLSTPLPAQNNVKVLTMEHNDTYYKYGEIIGHRDLYGNVTMQIDTGQLLNVERLRGQRKKNDAQFYLYESYAAAMNDMSPMGWQLFRVYNWSYRETENEIRWIVRRRLEK